MFRTAVLLATFVLVACAADQTDTKAARVQKVLTKLLYDACLKDEENRALYLSKSVHKALVGGMANAENGGIRIRCYMSENAGTAQQAEDMALAECRKLYMTCLTAAADDTKSQRVRDLERETGESIALN